MWFGLSGAASSSTAAPDSGTSTAAEPPSPSPSPLTAERAKQLQSGLASGDEATTRTVVAVGDGQAVEPAVVASLAQFPITLDVGTFVTAGDGTGSVSATVASTPPTRWTVYLVYVDGQWLISASVPA